jgi:hypothetical protein
LYANGVCWERAATASSTFTSLSLKNDDMIAAGQTEKKKGTQTPFSSLGKE